MPSEKKYEQDKILKLLAQDSQYAFQLVFDSHRNKIYKVALQYLKSPVLAEEVVQDVFLKLWFHRKNLSGINSLEAWLYTVSKNLIINYLKKLAHEWTVRKDWQTQNVQVESTADLKVRNAEYEQLVQKALNNLSDQQRLVYKLAKEEGLTYEAIGQKLSLSPLTVKTHMSRALTSIRSFLKEQGDVFLLLLLLSEEFF